MSITAQIASNCTVVETLDGNIDSAPAGTRKITHSSFNESVTLDADSTPPATKTANFVFTLDDSGGTKSLDLNALVGTNAAVVDGEDLKVQYCKINNISDNTVKINYGASTSYDMMGADFVINLLAGQWFGFYGNDATPDIEGGVTDLIDFTGTEADTFEITIVMG